MHILVTGTAGFIGFHVARRLLDEGHDVTGIDGFTPYYDLTLKERRQALLAGKPGFHPHRLMLEDMAALQGAYGAGFDLVFHFAAQAGVRYSLDNPRAYVDANLSGTFNLLECMRHAPPRHALLASTSSVYGANRSIPFKEVDRADHPLTLYAATKKANEEMAHAYAHLFAIPVTMLRFFTVYGPWGRPDMALYKFVSALFENRPIDLYNHGDMRRDFTFIDDLAEAILRLSAVIPPEPGPQREKTMEGDSLSLEAPWRVVNIGAGHPVALPDFVGAIEAATGRSAKRHLMDMQPGDVPETYANTDLLAHLTGYRPSTPLSTGVPAFVDWYRAYYGI